MRRFALAALVVWACACGVHGRVPAWVAARANAALTPASTMCMEWAVVWNRAAKAHSNNLRVIGGTGRPYGEALARCVWFVAALHHPGYGCYRGLIDTSLRVWQRPLLVDCQRPWAGKARRVVPVA